MTGRVLVLACDPVLATRIAATPLALDTARWPAHLTVVRLAADEVLLIGDDAASVSLDDPHAIVAADHGWVTAILDAEALARLIDHDIEWALPSRPGLGQGNIAGVPAKVLLPADSDGGLLICHAALAHDLIERVG
jgi:hypothetical protein